MAVQGMADRGMTAEAMQGNATLQNAAGVDDTTRAAWKKANLTPLWESTTAHRSPTGVPPATHWSWREVRPLLEHALKVTSPEVVERRVLTLVDPLAPESEATVGTLVVALQSLLPGETARPHRHPMNAVRLVLEGSGAETMVDGKICPMAYGDLILTPGWCWHEHKHLGTEPVIWLDVLDVPLHSYLGTAEFQPGPVNAYPETMPDASFATASLLPYDVTWTAQHSPVFRYAYADAARAVSISPPAPDGHRRIRYSNPLTGGSAMPILDCSLVEVTAHDQTVAARSNGHAVFCVVEGEGCSEIGGASCARKIAWGPRDIVTIPPGNWVRHRAKDTARLFCVSDRDLLMRLGLWKEELRW